MSREGGELDSEMEILHDDCVTAAPKGDCIVVAGAVVLFMLKEKMAMRKSL